MDRTSQPPIEYTNEYFFDQYKKQYGKTYLEDFDNIKNTARCRLKILKNLLYTLFPANRMSDTPPKNKPTTPSLLDIGCAYGPFLAAAHEEGFTPAGIDPAEDAVRYVQQELGIPAIHGFFPEMETGSRKSETTYKLSAISTHMDNKHTHTCSLPPAPYDAVTLWFVIEHFTDCVNVLTAIKDIIKPGGIFAFSTPSFSGISGQTNLPKFLSASPADHYTVWSPGMCRKALRLAGFKVKKIVIAGHHPERFPLLGKFAKSRKSPVYWLLFAISKLFRLGDTFEVYAVKK
jgi:2-polyprenyl-3-methyl-5-hydroxy-6-metoxy-1,4-benzoquinol methylase